MKYICLLVAASFAVSGCSSMGKSVTLGAVVGGSAGAAIGHNHGKRSSKKRVTGAAIGTTLGGLIGYLANREKRKKEAQKNNKKIVEEVAPLLSRPKVKRIWVKDQVKGKRFIRGHWEYIIQENSEWTR